MIMKLHLQSELIYAKSGFYLKSSVYNKRSVLFDYSKKMSSMKMLYNMLGRLFHIREPRIKIPFMNMYISSKKNMLFPKTRQEKDCN